MALINNLYNIEKVDKSAYTIVLNPDSVILKAHFPGQPVVPGVCTVQIAAELAEIMLKKRLRLTDIKNAKFIIPITPTEEQTIIYDFTKTEEADDNSVALQVVVKSPSNDVFAKLSLRCKII